MHPTSPDRLEQLSPRQELTANEPHLQIEWLPVEMLRPAPYNPRQDLEPDDPRYRKLRRSLRRFGLVEPLVWNRRTGHVVGGHQRLKILRELGWRQVPVSVVDLDPDRERALNLMLNNRAAQSDWNVARLREVLEQLEASPTVKLADAGFTPGDLNLLREPLTPLESLPQEKPAIEVILRPTPDQWKMLRSDLDALIQKHQVECHVRGGL
ncbi:MAG: ParB N-terminal domain-containing protein [Gemmatales bacterium]|nr:ParB N-terminal domain-containing protein [Gemmatales bacterium]MDW8388110.1 ParB N-terminal domain-containing protein [Gemmatales bacterium]